MTVSAEPGDIPTVRPSTPAPRAVPVPRRTVGDRTTPLPTLPLGDPTGGADALRWKQLVDGPQRYPHVSIDRDVEIVMSDGVTLRATVIRPADAMRSAVSAAHPAIISMNPYNRALLDAIDTALHNPVFGRGLRGLAGAVDLTGTPLAGVTGVTQTLSGGALEVFGINREDFRVHETEELVQFRPGAPHHD